MKKRFSLWVGVLALFSFQACAGDLSAQLSQFFKARNGQNDSHVNVVVRTPEAQWPACDNPQFALPGNARLWGMMSVAANCGQDRRYIQVTVEVTGKYIVATRQIPRGTPVTPDDVKMVSGRLDTLPARTAMSLEEVVDAVTMRDIMPSQPVTLMMVRQPWRVRAGQSVMVTASGDGFAVTSEGRAMNNATSSQSVRVRMGSGQIVSGRVDADGKILISL